MSSDPAAAAVARAGQADGPSVWIVVGDLVMAEPVAERIASARAELAGVEVRSERRPAGLEKVLEDLQTFSLFESGKCILAIETALFADRRAAADLIDAAGEVLPLPEPGPLEVLQLDGKAKAGASRLLQACRLFGINPSSGPAVLADIPDWAFQGGAAFRKKRKNRGRGKKQVAELRSGLGTLLEAGLVAGLVGWAESDASALGQLLEQGLPDGHSLVLCESSAAPDHPIVERLAAQGAVVSVGHVEVTRQGGFEGLGPVAAELERETGARIEPAALQELARRTLRKSDARGGGGGIHADSTSRLAGEYRKLASLADGGPITRTLVEDVVVDRGEEDVWKLLDAVGDGKPGEALSRLRRMMASADDEMAARLSFFSLISGFCTNIVSVQANARLLGVTMGESNYNRFKSSHAPRLQGELPDGIVNPLAGMHPFRLFRIYSAASRLQSSNLNNLPARVLETEMRLKGESGEPEVALAQLVAAVSVGGRRSRARRR